MTRYVAAIDQGTTSTRCFLFDRVGRIAGRSQREHHQYYPRPGWVEHDAEEIWGNVEHVFVDALGQAGSTAAQVAAIGIANQRETVVAWNRQSGRPLRRAIVWQDMRTDALCQTLAQSGGINRFREQTGLPLATYFSGPKLAWLFEEDPHARRLAEQGALLSGTIDSWLIWRMTGGTRGGCHITDVSNASRTLLMNLRSMDWDDSLLDVMRVPRATLPKIRSSSEVYGIGTGLFAGIPVASALGDQQAALFGQTCFSPGQAKNTYGTGCFLLLNTGEQAIASRHGLLTTLGWRIGTQRPIYALEGSVAIAGALIQWLRDQLGLFSDVSEVERWALTVEDHGGVYIVPAFSGLFAPYWRSDARGAIFGLTAYANRGHLARAALEATAFQTRDVADAMCLEPDVQLDELRVDGGMTVNDTLMQFQSDILNRRVVRPSMVETTAQGAAFAAGLAIGFWDDQTELKGLWREERAWEPRMNANVRSQRYSEWTDAVSRTVGWIRNQDV